MTLVYVISKVGVYEHFVPGVWSNVDRAKAAALDLTRDERPHPAREPDGYHRWSIYAFPVDQSPDFGGHVGEYGWLDVKASNEHRVGAEMFDEFINVRRHRYQLAWWETTIVGEASE